MMGNYPNHLIRSVSGVTWSDREGSKADRSQYFKGANPGADTKRTMNLAGLLVFTDARISQYPDTGQDHISILFIYLYVKFDISMMLLGSQL